MSKTKYYKLQVPIVYWVEVEVTRPSSEMTRKQVIESVTSDEIHWSEYWQQVHDQKGHEPDLFHMGLYEGYPERIETQVLVTDKEDFDGDENGYPSQDLDDYSELTDEMEDGGLSQFFKKEQDDETTQT